MSVIADAPGKTLMERHEFEALVKLAYDELPPEFKRDMENVTIEVRDFPDERTIREEELDDPYELLGYYHGIPITERGEHYQFALPDRISIYQKPIEAEAAETDQDLYGLVREILEHEIGHYYGMSEEELDIAQGYDPDADDGGEEEDDGRCPGQPKAGDIPSVPRLPPKTTRRFR
jgi:predicted Zn-dependent protease with MMP-like domain